MELLLLQYHKQITPPHRLTDNKLFRISKMEEFTYEQIRAKAIKQGVKDNKVHIGLWANLNNYLKTKRKKNGKVTTYYISLQKLAYQLINIQTDMIIHLPTGKKFHNRKEAKIYFGTAYYYKMEREKKDLVFTNNVQSATNEYEDTSKIPAKQGQLYKAGLCHH